MYNAVGYTLYTWWRKRQICFCSRLSQISCGSRSERKTPFQHYALCQGIMLMWCRYELWMIFDLKGTGTTAQKTSIRRQQSDNYVEENASQAETKRINSRYGTVHKCRLLFFVFFKSSLPYYAMSVGSSPHPSVCFDRKNGWKTTGLFYQLDSNRKLLNGSCVEDKNEKSAFGGM